MKSLREIIEQARQAQIRHDRRIDIQLELAPDRHEWASQDEIQARREQEDQAAWEAWFRKTSHLPLET